MNRRGFLGLLAGAVAAPLVPQAVEQWKGKLWTTGYLPHKHQVEFWYDSSRYRKISARIVITEEAMQDNSRGCFVDAAREHYAQIARDIARREDAAWAGLS